MIVWTYHPQAFRLTDPNLVIDPTKGEIWNFGAPDRIQRYRRYLPMLQNKLGTKQFLWCCLEPGQFIRVTPKIDIVEWELNVPDSHVLSLYREDVWEDLYYGRAEEWDKLLIDGLDHAEEKAGALIKVPIEEAWATCREVQPKYPC